MVLDTLAASLVGVPNQLAVEGHTDNVPINTAQFPSNWELSTARATAVLRYLVEHHGIAPARLSAAGYADQRPVAPNDTGGGRARNRRVDLAILSLSKNAEVAPTTTPPTTAPAHDTAEAAEQPKTTASKGGSHE
jgi:chemotaxis protein MotB